MIATVGPEPCFALNAASFGVMIFALATMDRRALQPSEIAPREPHAVRAALALRAREPPTSGSRSR